MRAASFVLNLALAASLTLESYPEIQAVHRAWAEQLRTLPHGTIIDIGAYLTLARKRSAATLTAQQLLINLHAGITGAREGIALGRTDPGKQYPSYNHIAERAADLARAYEELFLLDRAYARTHEALTEDTPENRAVAHVVKNADDIVRAAVMQALVTGSPCIVREALAKIGSIAQFFTDLVGPSKRSPVDLFRQILLTSYREFTIRYGTIGGGLWRAVASHEETTLELWRIIESARMRTYEALCAALCEKYIDASACND